MPVRHSRDQAKAPPQPQAKEAPMNGVENWFALHTGALDVLAGGRVRRLAAASSLPRGLPSALAREMSSIATAVASPPPIQRLATPRRLP